MRRFVAVAAIIVAAGSMLVAQASDTVYEPGNGVSLPVAIKSVRPEYTPDAMKSRIEGGVTLSAVVRPDGHTSDIAVVKSLDDGLDRNAVEAFRQWEFKPGEKDGKPVAVKITVVMRFTLK